MSTFVMNQTHIFFIFVLYGAFIGLLFDVFRILRRSFKTPDIVTYIEDVAFWLLTCIIISFAIFHYNNGELRAYLFIGLLIGLVFYILCFSKFIIKVCVNIIITVKKLILHVFAIISYPLKILFVVIRKLFFKPISFICINIRKYLSNNVKKYGKIFKKKLIQRRI